jgi:hypothetical protein
MKLTELEFKICKNLIDHTEITRLRENANLYVRCGTIGITFFKRMKYEFVEIAHVNNFRELSLMEFNKLIK